MKQRSSAVETPGRQLQPSPAGRLILSAAFLMLAVGLCQPPLAGQAQSNAIVTGTVVDLQGIPIAGAAVTLHESSTPDITGKTDASGIFRLHTPPAARYEVSAQTLDHRRGRINITSAAAQSPLRIVVMPVADPSSTMEFLDKPDFTVAGVTDWTAVGGHGSDATLRTSEQMARQTLDLKDPVPATTPRSRQATEAVVHRLQGERNERLGDPLAAAREEERATALDPTEQNYFTWGSELLLHRAIWQAAEVFAKGAALHPGSQRLRMGWGAALFAGARYEDSAAHLCEASDLDPANRETYLFLGKLALGSPTQEPCVGERLARFLQMHPDDADANFYEAMLLLKGKSDGASGPKELLQKAVMLSPGFAEAYLQLGILALAQRDNPAAQSNLEKAIAADPSLPEAHYRLGIVYDRTGHLEEAKAEFARHETLTNEQAATVERERRQLKQFMVVLGANPSAPPNP